MEESQTKDVWTIVKILDWTRQYFADKGIENPRHSVTRPPGLRRDALRTDAPEPAPRAPRVLEQNFPARPGIPSCPPARADKPLYSKGP